MSPLVVGFVVALVAVLAPSIATASVSVFSVGVGICCGVLVAVGSALFGRAVYFLGKDEQLKVEHLTETKMHNGPGITVLNPFTYRGAVRMKGVMLGTVDYAKVKDTVSGKERVERGPQLLFLEPYDEVIVQSAAVTLSQTEYMSVEDQLTGQQALVKGPRVWYPGPYDKSSGKKSAVSLQEDEYVRIKDEATGHRWVQRGKALLFLEPTWKLEHSVRKAWTLKAFEYVRLLDSVTGKISVHRGEQVVFPGANEDLLDKDKLAAIDLKVDEYVKIVDQTTSEIRVQAGAAQVFLGPTEKCLDGGKQKAVQVDEEHAALVRDTSTGQLRLHKVKELFVPGAHEVIEEVRPLITLADHEAMIVKSKEGHLNYHYGTPARHNSDKPRAFFLEPHNVIWKLRWSSGLRRERRDLTIERFDLRAQYMWFEFDCRTSDNVELVLEVTIFWEVVDLAKMVDSTGNLPGDIYNQLRSQFITQVAKVTLKSFMEELHSVSRTIHEEGASFYATRGVKINSLQVTRYKCSEQRTSEVLQQIIEETTNRLNRLSQAESENEVKIFKMQGQIEQEKLNAELLEIQHKHQADEARVAGAGEAERIGAFVRGLKEDVPNLEDRISMWQVLRKTEALSVVSEGGASLYYTPNDVDLSIRTGSTGKS